MLQLQTYAAEERSSPSCCCCGEWIDKELMSEGGRGTSFGDSPAIGLSSPSVRDGRWAVAVERETGEAAVTCKCEKEARVKGFYVTSPDPISAAKGEPCKIHHCWAHVRIIRTVQD